MRLVARFAVLSTLAAVAVLVGLDVWSRQPLHVHHRPVPLGASMAACQVLLVLVGFAAYELTPRAAGVVPALTVLSSVLLVIDLIQRLDRYRPALPGQPMLVAAVISLLVVVDGKIFLLHRFARRAERSRDGAAAPLLLPSQDRDIKRLTHLVTISGRESGRVIPIQGRWGEGKSFVLRCAKQRWDAEDDPGSPTMVIVDVWQQETEVDLQISIIETLLSHRRFLSRYRWLKIPSLFLFARGFAYLANSASTIKLKLLAGSSADVEADLKLPRLRWQPLFQRIVAAGADSRTVIALDEVDRATPAIAQAALTLARRSADVPGVIVLIPYIRPLMRYKAFNPLLPTLPDLASSMEAVLYEDALGRSAVTAADAVDPAAGGSIHDWLKSVPSPSALAVAASGGAAKDGAASPHSEISGLLTRSYMSAPRDHREMLVTKFEEKYLGPASLQLHQPNYDDVAAMLVTFGDLREIVQKLLNQASLNGETMKRIEDYVKNGYEAWTSAAGIPPLRALHSALYSIFSAADEVASRSSAVYGDVDIATLAVVALDAAAQRDLR